MINLYIYGKNTVNEALKTNKDIEAIYLATNGVDTVKFEKIAQSKNIELIYCNANKMTEKFGKNHQGIVAKIRDYEYYPLERLIKDIKDKEDVALAILDGLEDPHNLGAIMRTADASGMDGIIIPKNRSVGLNGTVAKVSTGAIEHVKVVQVANLVQTIQKLKDNGFWVVGLDMDGSTDYKTHDYRGKIAVVIGSEGKGISRLVKENCDYNVHIPMVGHVTSLNASVSASLLFYEILRNR